VTWPAARLLLAGAAVVTGFAACASASGRVAVVAALVIGVAAANGYSKAYSP
jgi:hypothetical protein